MIKIIVLHTMKNIKIIFHAVLLIRLCVLIDLAKLFFLTEEKNAVYRFVEGVLNEFDYYKNVMKRHFNKNLVMSAEVDERFILSNIDAGYAINYLM